MCYPSRTPSAQLPTKSEFRTSKVRPIQIYLCKDIKTINDSLLFYCRRSTDCRRNYRHFLFIKHYKFTSRYKQPWVRWLGIKVNFMMEDVLNIFKSLFMISFIHVMIFNIYRHCYWSHPRRHPGGRTSHTR